MTNFFEQLPDGIQDHIRGITKTSGLPENEDSLELMAEAWIGKKEAFEREIENQNMEEVESLDKDSSKGALVMTFSGSLINVGPMLEGKRSVDYTSIGIREDVPESAHHDASDLAQNIEVDQDVEFNDGPVSSTSPAYKIAVFREVMSADEEEQALANATVMLTKEFTDINKTLIM